VAVLPAVPPLLGSQEEALSFGSTQLSSSGR
jgi:hypothetical protein